MTEALYGGEWTYSGDPSSSVKDAVRFWMQDVNPDLPLMSDTEVAYLASQYYDSHGSAVYVAAVGCEVLAAKFATQVPVNADGVSVGVGELTQRYNDLATSLREQYKSQHGLDASPVVSGVLIGEGRDPTIKPLVFGTGFMDNHWVGRQDYGDYHPGEDPWELWGGENAGTVGESTP